MVLSFAVTELGGGMLFCPRQFNALCACCLHKHLIMRIVCINTSLCANVAGAPRIYFALINSIDIVFLTPQYGNLIDFASVYKRIINPRDD